MTSSEEQREQQSPTAAEGGQNSNEGRNRRRRRRGRRPGEARQDGQEGTQQEHSQQGADNTPAPNDEPESSQQATGSDGERRGRNRRRNRRGRGNDNASDSPAEASGDNQTAQADAEQSVQPTTAPAKPQGPKQHQPKKQQEKKERPPRGSVLNRRQTRGDYDDAPKAKNEAPAYVPVVAATVELYVTQHKGWQKEALGTIRSIIKSAVPEIEESIMWSQPVFTFNGPVCFMKAYADAIHFGFWRGTELDDSENLLEGGDLIMMRHITIKSVKDIKADVLESMVRQAARLNRDKGDPTLS